MSMLEIQGRLNNWRIALSKWTENKQQYDRYTGTLGDDWLEYLESIFKQQYPTRPPMIELAKLIYNYRINKNPTVAPYINYITVCAENIEPPFFSRLRFYLETKIGETLDERYCKEDRLYYLLCSNMTGDNTVYMDNLQEEVIEITNIILKEQKHPKTPRNETICEYIKEAIDSRDPTSKHFIILCGLLFEAEYRKKFIDPEDPKKKILVHPKRFFHFVTNTLPYRYKHLVKGGYSGVKEFARDVIPEYKMGQ